MTVTFNVLVVEDDPLIAQLLAERVSKNESLNLVGLAATARQAIDQARRLRPDLVLLDFGLPESETAGFDVWRVLHELKPGPQVIAVTGAREMGAVEEAERFGVFEYVIKPFTPATIDAKLAAYIGCRRRRTSPQQRLDQKMIDIILNRLHRAGLLPKGLDHKTMESVVEVLRAAERPLRTEEVGAQIGVNRETANKYLIPLCDQGIAVRTREYGQKIGQPPYLYSLAPAWKG